VLQALQVQLVQLVLLEQLVLQVLLALLVLLERKVLRVI
jgi:hypothetical protein